MRRKLYCLILASSIILTACGQGEKSADLSVEQTSSGEASSVGATRVEYRTTLVPAEEEILTTQDEPTSADAAQPPVNLPANAPARDWKPASNNTSEAGAAQPDHLDFVNEDGQIIMHVDRQGNVTYTCTVPYDEAAEARKALELINQIRAENGVAPLAWDDSTYPVSMIRAHEIEASFSHTSASNNETMGENILYSSMKIVYAADAVESWRNSPGHYRNMINPKYTSASLAVYFNRSEMMMYWVTSFNSPESAYPKGIVTLAEKVEGEVIDGQLKTKEAFWAEGQPCPIYKKFKIVYESINRIDYEEYRGLLHANGTSERISGVDYGDNKRVIWTNPDFFD